VIFDYGFGNNGKFISRQGMRDDKHSGMGTMLIKKLDCQADKIISVAGYKTSALC
jgi:hypothetical protein